MKIYIAAPWSSRDFAKVIAQTLETKGHLVVSTWHDGAAKEAKTHEDRANEAFQDLEELRNSNGMLYLGYAGSSGGRFVELGFALALQLKIVAVGDRKCVFDHLPEVNWVNDTFFLEAICDAFSS